MQDYFGTHSKKSSRCVIPSGKIEKRKGYKLLEKETLRGVGTSGVEVSEL